MEVTIKISPKARRWRLSVNAEAEAVLTVPRGTAKSAIDAVLTRHAGWIDRQKAKRQMRGEAARTLYAQNAGLHPFLGAWIALEAGKEERFYRAEAKRFFEIECHKLAAELGKKVERISVRDQKTRWGSCSGRGTLSFSWRILKAPRFVAFYLAAHECAHLAHKNHGAGFWACVAQLCPDYEAAERWLKTNGDFLRFDPWR